MKHGEDHERFRRSSVEWQQTPPGRRNSSISIDKHDIAGLGTIEGLGQRRTWENFVSCIH